MMFLDPEVLCVCDRCGQEETVTPDYKYTDMLGNKGFYDCSDESLAGQLKYAGWKFHKDEELLFCDECKGNG